MSVARFLTWPCRPVPSKISKTAESCARTFSRSSCRPFATVAHLLFTSGSQRPTQPLQKFKSLNKPRNSLPLNVRRFNSTSAQIQEISENNLDISDKCVARLKALAQKKEGQEVYLRVMVDSGGCSGFQYTFSLEKEQGEQDRVFEKDGTRILVDEVSWDFLKGSTIDYEEEMVRQSFAVTNNPNVEAGCGCGASFSVKL